ncbi:MAG: peptidoglycan-associated lipoprotein Pal [Nitrospinae bacterium]|nr:peptidoglycan-associated lipoprotein Pal [Nitrospinota bacterium]
MKQEEGMKPAQPGAPVETAATSTEAGGSFVVNLDRIYFDFDKFDITAPSRETLAKDAGIIKANPGVKVVIEGHCDERGTSEYNLALGERRASAAKKYLVSLGVDESRLYTISYGEEKPADAGHNEAAWAKNRRVQYSQE